MFNEPSYAQRHVCWCEAEEKAYKVQGEPENFLIDQNGKIVFDDFMIEGNNHRTFELMINSLL